ncbi:hypothetical protein PVK06_004389 [Gossypium arboreum]|uniref:Aminotransferase-like plant mobile domain-containing protein n=1 Tax=Gossypium arboreum TaxID=29729 RepID=A0ABR0QSS5_GOSAR|nr:hypothetical protein PVK06_004389 [Gossypium arboreum]
MALAEIYNFVLQFVWMPYTDLRIQECVLEEFLANRSIWHVKVSLIVFATVEMHKFNRVMRQFGCTQCILQQLQELDDLHKNDMRGRPDED